MGRGGSHRSQRSSPARVADRGEPPDRYLTHPDGGQHRHDQRRDTLQHHPGWGGDDGHHFRSYEDQVRKSVHEKVRRTVAGIAESAGAKAEVTIIEKYDPTINDEALTERMLPTLRWAANGDVVRSPLVGAAEDFSFFAKQAPGLFFFLGITPRDQDLAKAAPNHSPEFFIDEAALIVGMRALAGLAVDYGSTGPNSALPEVSGAPSARPSGQ